MPELFNGTPVTTIDNDDRLAVNKPGVSGSKNILWSAFKTLLATLFCSLTGNQTISGVKTFTLSPQVPNPSGGNDAVNFATLSGIGAAIKIPKINQIANFQQLIEADQSLERIDLRLISGSVTVRCGTSANGTDIMSDKLLESDRDRNINLGKSFRVNTTLYFTITGGGTTSINIWYLPAIF